MQIHNEIAAEVPGLDGIAVTENGRVYRSRSGVWVQLRTPPTKNGYPTLSLLVDRKGICRHVHRLVLEAFVGPRPPHMCCRHPAQTEKNNG